MKGGHAASTPTQQGQKHELNKTKESDKDSHPVISLLLLLSSVYMFYVSILYCLLFSQVVYLL